MLEISGIVLHFISQVNYLGYHLHRIHQRAGGHAGTSIVVDISRQRICYSVPDTIYNLCTGGKFLPAAAAQSGAVLRHRIL